MPEQDMIIEMTALTINTVNTAVDFIESIIYAPECVPQLITTLDVVKRPLEDLFRLSQCVRGNSHGVMTNIANNLKPVLNNLQSLLVKMEEMFEPWLYPENAAGCRGWKGVSFASKKQKIEACRIALLVPKKQLSAAAIEVRK